MPLNPISNPPDRRTGSVAEAEEPVFRAPWEAHAFVLTLSLQASGLFTWNEWTAVLAEEIKRAQAAGDPDTGETYYRHWLSALERLMTRKGITTPASLARYRQAWINAAARTGHGAPVALKPQDFP
jgi:nitrile hydratase accessory protein